MSSISNMLFSKNNALTLPHNSGDESPTYSISHSGDSTPLHRTPKSLRPYLMAILAFKHGHHFQSQPSNHRQKVVREILASDNPYDVSLTPYFVGLAAAFSDDGKVVLAIAIHDSTYLHDFQVRIIGIHDKNKREIEEFIAEQIVADLSAYERANFCKFVGAGIPRDLSKRIPIICSRLWTELDIVPIVMEQNNHESYDDDGVLQQKSFWGAKCVDEQADSMARKCVLYFGPSLAPVLQVGFRGVVEIDAGFDAHMSILEGYKNSCGEATWRSMMKFARELNVRKTKIAFFSSTPQGGGVALMRHALVRFAKLVGVDLAWYVPKPKPGVFRITKTVHNILQGVAKAGEFVSQEDKITIHNWIIDNAHRYWLSPGGPLCDPSKGGADVVVIDDPQMPGLIPLIKKHTPDRPVLYRSHIQIRSDLVDTPHTPQADMWKFLWNNIQQADMFIAHPIPSFVPANVPSFKVGYMPATTDWLDGLNKPLSEWDMRYYGHMYKIECQKVGMTPLQYPARQYFIQVARFDPAKGISDVLKSYAEFRRLLSLQESNYLDYDTSTLPPQLLIVGNASIDDPDGTIIYDATITLLECDFAHLISSVSMMRLPPNDQLLNTLLSNAHTVLQLSTREGFEVKVSEALRKSKPVIATNVGGIPLQIQDGRNGFLVQSGDWKRVGENLMQLWTDNALYAEMSKYAAESVSDEVGTVGNALSWFYLAVTMQRGGAEGEKLKPQGNWVNDLAREEANEPYSTEENRIERKSTIA